MRQMFIILGVLVAGYASAQTGRVGINTDTPSATLNVKSKSATATDKNLELENATGSKIVTVLNSGRMGIGTETPENKLHIMSDAGNGHGVKITGHTNIGGYVDLENTLKDTAGEATRWRIYNMTDELTSGGTTNQYTKGLHFWAYATVPPIGSTEANLGSKMFITDEGKVGIGLGGRGVPTQKLDVSETVRLRGLSGTGDRVVLAEPDGTLKVGGTVGNSGINTDPTMQCNVANAGKINFGAVTLGGKNTEAFGFCMKNSDGTYKWYYIVGGTGATSNSGAFGSGL